MLWLSRAVCPLWPRQTEGRQVIAVQYAPDADGHSLAKRAGLRGAKAESCREVVQTDSGRLVRAFRAGQPVRYSRLTSGDDSCRPACTTQALRSASLSIVPAGLVRTQRRVLPTNAGPVPITPSGR